MNLVLYRKWRPQTWEDVVGQKHVIHTLQQAVVYGRIAHAYLFSGPRGTGKTTTARILAKAVNCLAEDPAARPCNRCSHCQAVNEGSYLDLIEIDAASNTSVEDVRDLRERINFAPNEGRYKVYIIDEVHMLSSAAFNALLKTLEEPPEHAIFILATTEAHKIPPTVISRCQRHEFRRLGVEEMIEQLAVLVKAEGLQAERGALEAVARQATGSLRDAISLLDQLASLGEAITLERALEMIGSAGSESVRQLAECIAGSDMTGGLKVIYRAVDSGADARQFARQVVDILRGVMMAASGNADLVEAAPDTRVWMKELAAKMSPAVLLRAIRAFSLAAADTRSGWRPQLPLELAFIDSVMEISPPGGMDVKTAGDGGAVPPSTVRSAPPQTPSSPSGPASAPPKDPAGAITANPVAEAEKPSIGGLTLDRVRESWSRVLGALRQKDIRCYTLFANSQPDSLEGDLLGLVVDSDLVRQKCSRQETLLLLQGVMAEVIGQPLGVRFTVGRIRKTAEGTASYPQGGIVDTASREFGAQVIDLP